METYIINENLKIEAWYYETSRNWGHKARAIYNGREVAEVKIVYQNRTWESYKYQSVMQKLIDAMDEYKTIPLADRIEASKMIKTGDRREMKKLAGIGAMAMMAGIIGGKEAKARVLGSIPGIIMPENVTEEALDGAINILIKK